MYLSRVEIDTKNRQKMRDLTHVGAYHAWVEDSFPNQIFNENGHFPRKLWRIDKINQKQYLLLVSEEKPELEKLEKYGVNQTGQSKNYQPFIDKLKVGEKVRFRLVANPVISKFIPGQRGRVMPHVTIEQQEQFLIARSKKNGFMLKEGEFSVVNHEFVNFKHKSGKTPRLSKTTYEGNLTITDIDKFKTLLVKGLGKKKAYGFGLMTVIPIGD
ncbi:type I-E CRISPR-associated protein Cas6/Cse3/CasE [Pseudolactococcus reticulitermitis]|uniref:CRISPR-associated protein Cse3 family n=1 Tax=Pseudolactococcus reticulitermitis TaxID=2025039 RepID=A0A224X4L3_9LACT|nr:type I-E CRISPR-associated protein Cas6/Cse3/CasE [Lactococcus reticulitermitis]GAX46540.1 CRISPR-associated protein Cse3 family [Lactococcus reticulitermitis]